MRAMATRTSRAVGQACLAQSNAMSALHKALHEIAAFLAVHGAEVASSAGLRLIQRMHFGTNILRICNVVVPMAGSTAHGLGIFSEGGVSMHAHLEFLLSVLVTSRAIDSG